jgi:thioredoxin 1
VIDFFADWCDPCRQLEPVFDAASARHAGRLNFGRLDVDHNPQAAARLSILTIPTSVVFHPSGHEIDRLKGATGTRQLSAFLDYALSRAA